MHICMANSGFPRVITKFFSKNTVHGRGELSITVVNTSSHRKE